MKLILAAIAAAGLAAPAMSQGVGGIILTNTEFQGGFSNNGQCTAALAKVRNKQRLDASLRGEAYRSLSASAFQKASLRTTRCERIDGRHRVVFYADGFPG
ncbi:hypothetical protein LZ496_11085 [Sphingomonas sp. NSE70-1]|uniref:Beta/Gamma crystallin n=1 Tax=Sphingomonas caseinilyticus TaxID=2908205 RepID=A0ABT0RWN4_9SPHN|nr:hypothetical protein [Sphingomonas caseinilyticus]MCL6699321.1 hypothetical protein [Sphingomonas caseinilyticus]